MPASFSKKFHSSFKMHQIDAKIIHMKASATPLQEPQRADVVK
ncbi:MAG: hypothetical protein H6R05_380 [Burkholderiaceae bacterium]|nr:hypothetical protein [Burkholderiaceae bacterium]